MYINLNPATALCALRQRMCVYCERKIGSRSANIPTGQNPLGALIFSVASPDSSITCVALAPFHSIIETAFD